MESLRTASGRKTVALFIFLFFPPLFVSLHAGGKAEEEKEPANNEWILCVTAFDVSSLPASGKIMGDIVTRDLANVLSGAGRRFRNSGETAFYEDYAWSKARTTAAKALSAKRNERDLLIYQGEAGWKYRKNLKAKDAEIAKLEEDLKNLEAERPEVNGEPVFKLAETNTGGTWPAPPAPGAEYRFCVSQKADAFVTGSLSEFHGRIFVRLKMYTFHTRSYSYEDSVIFSSDDIEPAMEELSGRVFASVLGTTPAVLTVRAEPEDAVITVDGLYAGRGEAAPKDRAPGETEIEVYAEHHVSSSFPVELNSGELAELYVNLSPVGLSAFTVDVPGSPGASVYNGGLYLGTSPLRLEIPTEESAYISVETPSGETGAAVYHGGGIVRGSAEFINGGENIASYSTRVPVDPNEKRVDRSRRGFYGAYGRLWIALPVSMLAIGMADNYINAYNYSPSLNMYDSAVSATYVRYGAYALIGIVAVDTIIRIIRYLYISGEDAAPIVSFPDEGAD